MAAETSGEAMAAETVMAEAGMSVVRVPTKSVMSVVSATAAVMGPPRVLAVAMMRGMAVMVMPSTRGVTTFVSVVPTVMMPGFVTARVSAAVGHLPGATMARRTGEAIAPLPPIMAAMRGVPVSAAMFVASALRNAAVVVSPIVIPSRTLPSAPSRAPPVVTIPVPGGAWTVAVVTTPRPAPPFRATAVRIPVVTIPATVATAASIFGERDPSEDHAQHH